MMATIFTRRVIAYVIDFFVISAVMWILAYLFYFFVNPYEAYSVYKYFPYILPVLIMVYFVYCEKVHGASIGKSLLYLQVRSRNGAYISWAQAIVRNLSKMYWVPVIFDWIIGKLTGKDRLLGNFTRTSVVDEFR